MAGHGTVPSWDSSSTSCSQWNRPALAQRGCKATIDGQDASGSSGRRELAVGDPDARRTNDLETRPWPAELFERASFQRLLLPHELRIHATFLGCSCEKVDSRADHGPEVGVDPLDGRTAQAGLQRTERALQPTPCSLQTAMRSQITGRGMPMPSSQRRSAGTEPPLAFADGGGRRRELSQLGTGTGESEPGVPTWDTPAVDAPTPTAAAHEVSQVGAGTGEGEPGAPTWDTPGVDATVSAAAAHEVSQLGTGTGEGEPGVPTWDTPGPHVPLTHGSEPGQGAGPARCPLGCRTPMRPSTRAATSVRRTRATDSLPPRLRRSWFFRRIMPAAARRRSAR